MLKLKIFILLIFSSLSFTVEAKSLRAKAAVEIIEMPKNLDGALEGEIKASVKSKGKEKILEFEIDDKSSSILITIEEVLLNQSEQKISAIRIKNGRKNNFCKISDKSCLKEKNIEILTTKSPINLFNFPTIDISMNHE